MSNVILYGLAPSSYVRTARLVCEEKGIDYRLEPVELGSADHETLHPYKKIPILKHGDVHLWETQAIARYLDETFDGPSLTPASPAQRGVMEQWISTVNCYLYAHAVKGYSLPYIFGKEDGPDRAVVDPNIPKMERDFALLDAALDGSTWLAGDDLSLADLFVFPIVGTASLFPEAKELIGRCKNLGRALAAMADRPSWAAVTPSS